MINGRSRKTAAQHTDERMARETKVGLIVGLGVILFVSVMLSEYFIQEVPDPSPAGAYANFYSETTNQPPMPEAQADDRRTGPIDSQAFAAAILERAERDYGPTPIVEHSLPVGEPPVRRGPPTLATHAVDTPAAYEPERLTGGPIGQAAIDHATSDRSYQLNPERVRVLRDLDPEEDILMVPIDLDPVIGHQPQQIRHTVRAGENLSKIARKYYDGDGNMWRSIRDANRGLVGRNGEVRQGAVLVIPKRSTEAAQAVVEIGGAGPGRVGPQRQRVRLITVEPGDSLSELAAKHLGSAGAWKKIMAVNSEINKPEHITPGMKIRIPVDDPDAPTRATTQRTTRQTTAARQRSVASSNVKTYTVKSGDNLYRIAAKALGDGERYKEIYQANRDQLASPNDITPGMKLKLPAR